MSDRIPRDEEHRLRDGLERLAGRAPRTFDAPPGMLRRARRRLAAVVTAVVVVAASVVVGGVALGRVLSDRNSRPAPATTTGPTTPPPSGPSPSFQASSSPSAGPVPVTCSFGPQPIPQLPGDLAKVVHRDGSFQLAGADGPSPDDVWVVGTVHGAFGKPAVTTGVVLHWDGSSMRVLPPFRGTGFGSVDAPAADDAWASTGAGPLHWNGASWSSDGRPVVAGGTNDLAVSAAAPDDVWAVGTRPPSHGTDSTLFAERFDGTRWTEAAVPKDVAGPVMALDSVAAIAPDDAWAVGGDEAATDPGPPVVLRWDGAGWRAV
ncbi:MAG TPA: hypothetical protein VNN79_25390, partial [Actinomycetota bacterium]|nr:hypothetical protein [Actinomycetota bacterium]